MRHSRSDELFTRECLNLAEKGRGLVNPNPMVGAVVVKNKRIIGKGYHLGPGLPHAEIEALEGAGKRARSATLYTNLEPCCHFGRTPPCTEAIIRAGVTRVVCSTLDPDKRVTGRGVTLLRKAGIRVSLGTLEQEARLLNEAFFRFHEQKRPFVALKFAASLDGKMATSTGDSQWITNEDARKYARTLRGNYHAVLVGINTVLADDPHLGVRERGKRDPLRVILDSKLRVPLQSKVLRDSNVLVVTTTHASERKKRLLEARGVPIHVFQGANVPLRQLLSVLARKKIISILVEGGGEVLGSFIDAKLADKVYAFYAPILLGGDRASTIGGRGARTLGKALRLEEISFKRFGGNFLIIGSNPKGGSRPNDRMV